MNGAFDDLWNDWEQGDVPEKYRFFEGDLIAC
jgi:hypothetical protein